MASFCQQQAVPSYGTFGACEMVTALSLSESRDSVYLLEAGDVTPRHNRAPTFCDRMPASSFEENLGSIHFLDAGKTSVTSTVHVHAGCRHCARDGSIVGE